MSSWLLLASLACIGQGFELSPSEKAELVQASHSVTWQTVSALGPHRTVARATRSDLVGDQAESYDLLWNDADNFQITWAKNGRTTRRTLLRHGQAWSGRVDALRSWPDAGLYRGELESTWNLYNQVLTPFVDRMVLEYTETLEIQGRTAWSYQVSLAQGPAPKRGLAPRSLRGTVILDKATAARLKVELQGTLWDPEVASERTMTLNIDREQIGSLQSLSTPPPSERR